MLQLLVLGGQPATAAEVFNLLHNNQIVGLLRLDLPTILAPPLYYVFSLGLFAALRQAEGAIATLSTSLAFVGVIPSSSLRQRLSRCSRSVESLQPPLPTPPERNSLPREHPILATDIWHGTGRARGWNPPADCCRGDFSRHTSYQRFQQGNRIPRHPYAWARSCPRHLRSFPTRRRSYVHGQCWSAIPHMVFLTGRRLLQLAARSMSDQDLDDGIAKRGPTEFSAIRDLQWRTL
jgi:hypothetical protein